MRAPKCLHVDCLWNQKKIRKRNESNQEEYKEDEEEEEEPECQGLKVKVKLESVDSSSFQRRR